MESVRLRRLKADHEALRRLARVHPKIQIEGVFGNPPERYRIVLKVKSLRERGEQIETVGEHRLEVTMPQGYPRDAPLFRMLSPVFHPNIAPHTVCIGDHWTAGESLEHLVQRVGEILAFQSYNTKSPLNGRAAQWVDEHRDRLPVDAEEFFLDTSHAPPAAAETVACANCGARGVAMMPCRVQHQVCGDCAIKCARCGGVQCLACGDKTCMTCLATATLCKNCGNPATADLVCDQWHPLCGDCGAPCPRCGNVQCVVCGSFPCRACAAQA
ncbi:MAG TPA: ubiquitin-conjugating enzyme E2 [Kofleriaceae bacterium]|nr:ubiquitin-conjugating enzyme E2 [Kofleriaceae bacterium]